MQMGLNERKYDDVCKECVTVSLLIMDIYLKRGNKRIYVKGLSMRSWILGKTKGYISFYDHEYQVQTFCRYMLCFT